MMIYDINPPKKRGTANVLNLRKRNQVVVPKTNQNLRRFFATVLIFLLAVSFGIWPTKIIHADTNTPSKWFGTYGAQTSTSLTRYFSPFGGNTPTTENNVEQITPSSGTVQKLNVKLDAAPGSGKSYVITFRKEQANTTLTCTISDLATSCSDIIHTVAITAGDRLSISIAPSGTPTAARVAFNLEFVPTTSGETVFMGGTNGNYQSDSSTSYNSFVGVGPGPTEGNLYTVIPASGTLKNLYFRLSAAPGTGNSRTFTLRKNGADTTLTVTFNAADLGVLSDTTHTVTVTAGDTITLKVTGVGTPVAAQGQFGVTFVPDNTGDFSIPITNSTVSNSAVNYLGLTGVNTVSATENLVQTLGSSDYTLTGVYIKLNSAPGASKSFTTGLREDSADASNPFTVLISGSSATTGSLTGQSFTPKDGSLYDTIITPSGTPTAGRTFVSYLGHMTPVTPDTTSPTPGNSGTIATANVAGHSLTLNWTKATDDTSAQSALTYRVYRSSSNNIDTVANIFANGTAVNASTTDINTLNISSLSPSTTYYFNVVVADQAGNTAIYTTINETTTSGNTYYVDNTNGSASDSNAGTNSSAPWLTIGKCASTMLPGDTCEIDGTGTYDERPSFTQVGTAQNPIVIKAASDCVPGNSCPKVRGIDLLSGNNYTTVRGLEFTNTGMSADSNESIRLYTSNSHVSILNNYVHDTTNICINVGDASFLHISGNTISHCDITTYAYGNAAGISNYFNRDSTDVLVENNTISHVSDYDNPRGARWVIRGNTWGPIDAANVGHVDGAQPNSITPDSLMENNLLINNDNDNNHLLVNQAVGSDNWIVRMNRVCQSHGMILAGDALNGHYYNNTFGTNPKATANVPSISLTNNATGFSRNQIFYKSSNTYISPYGTSTGATIDKDYDLYYLVGNPSETHSVNADPLFVDEPSCNLNLQSNSPAIDAGGPLTTVSGSDGGTGTSLVLSDAGYFQPGWAGTDGDWIAVGTVGNIVQVSAVDYTTNTLTLANSIARSAGDSVWLYKKSDGTRVLYGAAPDMGALEFNGVSTHTITVTAGANGSITPSGSVSVNDGSDQSFTITPSAHYHVADVLVDGSSVGAVTSYNFPTVGADHSISATFAIDTHTLTYTAGANGSITGTSPQAVNYGADGSAVTAVANSGYEFVNWSDSVTDNPRTDTSISGDVTVTANFQAVATPTPTPTVSSGGGGSPAMWTLPTLPVGGFKMSINGGATVAPSRNVVLGFNAGADIKKMSISMTGDFTDASQEDYTPTKQWDLCSKFGGLVKNATCPDGTYTVYARFYTVYGRSSPNAIASATITLKSGAVSENLQNAANLPLTNPFTRNLQYRQTDADVKRLQIFLNSDPDTRVADSGVGSSGHETNYFGTLTYKAVIKFQEKYARDVLAPWGFVKGTGYVGKTTLAKLNELLDKIIGQ